MKKTIKPDTDYMQSQPYKLGLLYKELGERLMDERTDIRDLIAICSKLGLEVGVAVKNTIDQEG